MQYTGGMHCPSCSAENVEGAKFCAECGTPFVRLCLSCGQQMQPTAKFCSECGTPLVAKGQRPATKRRKDPGTTRARKTPRRAPSPPVTQSRPTPAEAERRQLTVEFIDLVGSTTLSQQLDPEDYHARVVAYQAVCHQIIQRYEGHIAQYLGDGVLVYFGYPAAHEEDAVRAVRSGLEIVAAVSQLVYTPPLQVRIGIHTGPVVVGEIGAGERTERLALGETPNIAARVQGHAAPNEVLVSSMTFRLMHGLFETEGRGPQELKGISTPMTLYRVVRESTVQSRFEVAVQTGLTPLVGRAEELTLLQRRWEQAKAGEGQVVLLSGEPGIGKSRLVQELKEHVSAEGATRIEFRCSPYHQNSALYPIIDHLQRLLRFARDDTSVTKLEKLQHRLSPYRFSQADTVPLLAALLSLPHPVGSSPLTMSPQKQKEKTQAALVSWLVEEAEQAAVFCAWEDLHWADPSTLEVLTLLLDQVPTTQLLTLMTFRPEFRPSWGNRSHLSQLTLSRLGRPHVEVMVERVTGGKSLPSEIMQQIMAKTDGVPLFVEELTKTVVESGLLRVEGDRYVGAHSGASLPLLAIPSTLQDSLMARLDRLAPVKEIAQLGATIGREFSYELLHAVSPADESSLQQGLRQLVEVELLYQRGVLPHTTYLFKHALIQETAYQSLLRSTRRQYHRQIAQVLEAQFPETKEIQPELLARHYTEAGLVGQAVPYWQRAGERAAQRSAYVEAIAHLTKGLELLQPLPDTPERTQQELRLQLALAGPLTATKGYTAPEVERASTRALELCRQRGETPELFWALLRLWMFYLPRADHKTARELAEQGLSLAQNVHNPIFLVWGHFMLGATLSYSEEFTLAREHLEEVSALYDPQQHRSYGSLLDPGESCLSYAAWVLWFLGHPDQALQRSHEALTLAQELSHPFSLAHALNYAAVLHQLRREGQAAQERAEAGIALSTEQGFPHWLALGTSWRGWALAAQGEAEEGIAQIRQGLAAVRAMGAELAGPTYLALLAEAYGTAGQVEGGLVVLAEALDAVAKTGERYYEAELYRLKGGLTLAQSSVQGLESRVKEAEECFLKAIDIARKQQAKSWELRATISLARLWQSQGKQHEACNTLSKIYHWFTEGFDTKDLQEAKALLEELR
jgi:class 3 adenylate cyclase/predicted ATPase